MKIFPLFSAVVLLIAPSSHAQSPDVWGKSPTATDDRFSNPKSTLYAGPDGWYNTGEVRATVQNKAATAYKYQASFQQINGDYDAVKDLSTLHLVFGSEERPKPGVYKIGPAADPAQKTVRMSFSDVSGGQIKEWSAGNGAGALTVSLVNGFTYFTCRNVTLQPTGFQNESEMKKPMIIGFEGALSPE